MNNPNIIKTPEGFHVLRNDTHISRWVEQHKNLVCDPWLFVWLDPYLQDVDVIWDVGAFIGDHTEFYSRIAREVHAFEPNPEAFECLKENMALRSGVQCWNVAASDTFDTPSLVLNPNAGASHLGNSGDWKVTAAALDEFMTGKEPPGFIKLDVEGWEVKALKGMEQTIDIERPKMLVEINDGALRVQDNLPEDIFSFFKSYGYSTPRLYPRNAKLTDPQYDALFLP